MTTKHRKARLLKGGLLFLLACAILAPVGYLIVDSARPDLTAGAQRVAKRQFTALQNRWYDLRVTAEEMRLESAQERSALPLYRTIAGSIPRIRSPSPAPQWQSDLWLDSAGSAQGTRFSRASLLTAGNVDQLQLAWQYDGGGQTQVQTTPVFDGESLILVDANGDIVALAPDTGAVRWTHSPQAEAPRKGFTIYRESADSASYLLFVSGHSVFALDTRTGQLADDILGGGQARISGTSKVSPRVCGSQIAIALNAPTASLEVISLASGQSAGVVALAPDNLPAGTGGRPSRQGGGNPWVGFSIDPVTCDAFVSTGNPSPVLVGVDRRGDNPGTSSIVAVSMRDLEVLWRFQEIRHDIWDLDIGSPTVVADIAVDDGVIAVVLAATKHGNTLILDRNTGQPIHDFRLARAPTSQVPGERTSPYQPALQLPEPFSRQVFSPSDITNRSESARQSVLAQMDNATFGYFEPPHPNRPLVMYGLHGGAAWPGAAFDENDGAIYVAGNNVPAILSLSSAEQVQIATGGSGPGRDLAIQHCSACHGQDLQSGPAPNLVVAARALGSEDLDAVIRNGQSAMPAIQSLSAQERGEIIAFLQAADGPQDGGGQRFTRAPYRKLYDEDGYPGVRPPWGTLTRLDPLTGRIDWQVPLGRIPALEAEGIFDTGTENSGGPTITATGLVFVSGTKDKMIYAFDARNGDTLWSHSLPHIGSAPPMTFIYQGRQFVVLPATGGGTLGTYDETVTSGGTIVAFALQ